MPLFPSGWQEAFAERGTVIEMTEYVPEGQSVEAWDSKIVLQVYHGLDNLPLDAIQRRAQGQNRNRCTGVIEGAFQSGLNNGYPSAFWTLGCRYLNNRGLGEIHYTKAIQGEAALYVLTWMWRTQPFGEEGPAVPPGDTEKALAFLTTSVVCNITMPDRPCTQE